MEEAIKTGERLRGIGRRKPGPFDTILRGIERHPGWAPLRERIDAGGSAVVDVTGLTGSAGPCLVARSYLQAPRPWLIITANADRAAGWQEDLTHLLGAENVARFNAWETLPYEFRTPGPEATGRRLETLWRILDTRELIVVTHLRAALEPTLPPSALKAASLRVRVGESIPLDRLLRRLVDLGYRSQPLVEQAATFSHRGGIIDVFTYTESEPLRIEFFGDTVESIRTFSVSTQRSTARREQCVILPSREVMSAGTEYEAGWKSSGLDPEWRERVEYDPERPGLEWLAGAVGQPRARLFDYFDEHAVQLSEDFDLLSGEYERLRAEIERFAERLDRQFPDVPRPETIWGDEQVWAEAKGHVHVRTRAFRGNAPDEIDFGALAPPPVMSSIERLQEEVINLAKAPSDVVVCCDNEGQKRRLQELLTGVQTYVEVVHPGLQGGYILPAAQIAVLTEHEIFRRYKTRQHGRRFQEGLALSSYTQLKKADYVVHVDHGIARFRGLESIEVEGRRRDCLLLLFQGEDRLFVPIEEFDRVHKFTGREGKPTLSKLGGTAWEKTKGRAKKALLDMAEELISLYAERKAQPGFAFTADNEWIRQLDDSFVFDETPDQDKAIAAVRLDMSDPAPMDRLICGDVGYGKTEVAIRAAFRATCDHKQVAVLVPTTILAQQHLTTFRERLSEFPVRIETLSRFRTAKEQKQVVDDIRRGAVDIVIGTHRLLQKDIQFRDLGLLIVDEEQRFGVAHKEKLRQLQRRVDSLWLTATPIPRTLQMSLLGARDLSLINTSPKDRMPVITEVREFNPEIVTEAIMREVDRGGQVYFVHNRVRTIHAMADFLRRLIPTLRIAVAHGQMPERELESVMVRFYHHEFDVLLCTAIIESGLDLPSVNTIIIHRADCFGLSELYQLRGRVGRSARQAYAYLLTPPFSTLTTIANSRLKAIEEHTALGSGFHLAMRDLEIRGAGNILGRQQHGFIEEIGFDLYCRMLEEAVEQIRGTSVVSSHPVTAQIEVEGEKFIPDDYIADNQQRFEMYKRMAEARAPEQVDDLQVEMTDRFGTPPSQARLLLDMTRAKVLAEMAGVARASAKGPQWTALFDPAAVIDRNRVGRWRQGLGARSSFASGPPFRVELRPEIGRSADLPGLINMLKILAS